MNTRPSARVAVLGAGLTGAGTALELARRGMDVTLIDQDARACNRASLRNEGKIHLGLLYAKDLSLRSAELQLEGALSFQRLLRRWIGPAASALRQSTPFTYLVAHDSLEAPEQLANHYAKVDRTYLRRLGEVPGADYLGRRPATLVVPVARKDFGSFGDGGSIVAAFRTEERAIQTEDLAQGLRAALERSSHIRFLPRHEVRAVTRNGSRLRVEGSAPGESWCMHAEQVVNALWESRFTIDASFGAAVRPGWVHRLKYRTIVRLPQALCQAPSATMVLGRYGDVVIRPDRTAYVSWYPVGMQGWSHELAPPASWQAPCRGDVAMDRKASIARAMLSAWEALYPGIERSDTLAVDAGAIVAYGKSDVDDPGSGLHDRTQNGVTSDGGYHSVDPGKLTTAPLFAEIAAERVMAHFGKA